MNAKTICLIFLMVASMLVSLAMAAPQVDFGRKTNKM
jgi:hypothetical protein